MSTEDIVTLNVYGRIFEIERRAVLRHKQTRLGRILSDQTTCMTADAPRDCVLRFYRSVDAFQEILSFYETGELHMPSSMCPKAYMKELDFWEIDFDIMEKCCKFKVLSFLENQEKVEDFHKTLSSRKDQSTECKKNCIRSRIWAIIDNRENSIFAKIYMTVALMFVLLSIFNLAVSTLPEFKVSLTASEMKRYMSSREGEIDDDISEYLDSLDLDDSAYDKWHEFYYIHSTVADFDEFLTKVNDSSLDNDTLNQMFRFSKLSLPQVKTRMPLCEYLEIITLTFFTLELILRLVVCPKKLVFFQSVLNCIDIVSLLSTYTFLIISKTYFHLRYESVLVQLLLNIQALRSLRVLRILQNVGVIMVLRYSLLSSLKELLILLIYTLIAVNVFANFIHLAEEKYDIGTIPKAWYFGIVTMTTVGYGDLQPISTVGRFFASIGALSGIILVALIVPIIVNNYMSLYQVANFVCHRSSVEKIAKKKETPKQKKNPYCLQKILPSSK